MKAIILAAGEGTRLRPLTEDKPKCMVELCGRPLIYRQIDVLKESGIDDFIIIGGYRIDQLESLEGENIKLVFNERFDETNMVSSLFCAEDYMQQGEDMIISYADIVYEKKVIESLFKCNAPLCIAVDKNWREYWEARMDNPLEDAETLKLVDDNRIVELGKKPEDYAEIQGQYMGLYKVSGQYVDSFRNTWHSMDRSKTYDGKDFDNMYMTSYLQYLINSGWEARAAFTNNGWLEVDTLEDLHLYEKLYKDNRLSKFYNRV